MADSQLQKQYEKCGYSQAPEMADSERGGEGAVMLNINIESRLSFQLPKCISCYLVRPDGQ